MKCKKGKWMFKFSSIFSNSQVFYKHIFSRITVNLNQIHIKLSKQTKFLKEMELFKFNQLSLMLSFCLGINSFQKIKI